MKFEALRQSAEYQLAERVLKAWDAAPVDDNGFGETVALARAYMGMVDYCCEAEGVSVPKDIYEGALCYIKHVGSNWTMRGEPHPQQWLVDGLERCGRSEENG
jgi:hypothetical protein